MPLVERKTSSDVEETFSMHALRGCYLAQAGYGSNVSAARILKFGATDALGAEQIILRVVGASCWVAWLQAKTQKRHTSTLATKMGQSSDRESIHSPLTRTVHSQW